MKRNKQSKYRIKIIQEFHLNKIGQGVIDRNVKDYKRAYYLFSKYRYTLTRSDPYKFKFKYDNYINDIDGTSTIPTIVKPFAVSPKTVEKYYNFIGGIKNA